VRSEAKVNKRKMCKGNEVVCGLILRFYVNDGMQKMIMLYTGSM